MKTGMLKYLLLFIISIILACDDDDPVPIDPFENVWLDPAFQMSFENEDIVVWFDEQFLPDPDSYQNLQEQFSGMHRLDIRTMVTDQLKQLSNSSYSIIKNQLDSLVSANQIQELKQHWIINGFSCKIITEDGIKAIANLTGVSRIYKKLFEDPGPDGSTGPEFMESPNIPFNEFSLPVLWNLQKLRVPEVWELGYSGSGVKNVIHDFGVVLDVADIRDNLYQNPGEIPGNLIDDDGNGYVDDFNGYNFDKQSALITNGSFVFPGFNHGSSVAAYVCGRVSADTIVGVAPNATWATVRGIKNMEEMLEWTITQGFDTYSMSFSIADLGEFRDHYRKIFEQAAYCGIFFVSGAGNFANPNAANFAPIPRQMRFPEDIPEAVFGVTGVDSLLVRPVFSSQGPVEWLNDYYSDGTVPKPDFTTFNFGLYYTDADDQQLKAPVQGNSFAGPQLTGVIALMLSANSGLMPWEVKTILMQTAVDIAGTGFDSQSGHGLIDAFEAVKMAESF